MERSSSSLGRRSELTKKHKKRASATAVAVALVAGVLSPFAEAGFGESGGGPAPLTNPEPKDLGTEHYFRVTTTNTGDKNDGYLGCPDGNVDGACPETEMNIGVLQPGDLAEDKLEEAGGKSDNSRLVLEGNKGIRLTRKNDEHTAHKITFDAPVEAAEGSGAILIKQPVVDSADGKEKAGHTIIKSVIKSGSTDKIKVVSENGETTISWIGGDTAGGADGKSAYDLWKAKDGNADKSEADFLASLKGQDGADGRQVIEGKGITATVNTDNTLTIAAKTKPNGGISAQGEGLSIDTDDTTITLKSGKVSAVTGTITAGETPSVATADANKLAKAGEVAEAIKSAKTKVVAGNGIKVTSSGNEYTVSADLPFTKNAKDKSISLNEEGVIRNVANGRVAKDSKDAVNGGQLHAVERRLSGNIDKLNHRIDKVGKRADAGTASAIATANLLQSYRPGLSAATAAVDEYRGQSAVAVGYSRLSDNGKYGVKFSLGANTQGNVGAGAGVAYFW